MTRKDNGRVIIPVRYADRSDMVNQLFESAGRLGVERHEIRTASEGFNVPRLVVADLFPSLYPEG